jgi:hypothetical protein
VAEFVASLGVGADAVDAIREQLVDRFARSEVS